MSTEDDITAQLSTFLENDTDTDSDMDEIIDLSSKTENTPKDENEDEEEDDVLEASPGDDSTVLEATFEKSKKETENVSKLLSLPVTECTIEPIGMLFKEVLFPIAKFREFF